MSKLKVWVYLSPKVLNAFDRTDLNETHSSATLTTLSVAKDVERQWQINEWLCTIGSRSQSSRGLWRGPAFAILLGLRVRIPLEDECLLRVVWPCIFLMKSHGTIRTVHTTYTAAFKTTNFPKTRCRKPYAATQHLLLMMGVCARNMSS